MAKRNLMDGYQTYDAEREGYGSSWQWRQSFRERMGMDEARDVLQDTSPHAVLELPTGATWNLSASARYARLISFHVAPADNSKTASGDLSCKTSRASSIPMRSRNVPRHCQDEPKPSPLRVVGLVTVHKAALRHFLSS